MNIYDTTVTDEDEALVQVINHGSVHHAGFLSERTIFALSHDEHFSVHPATDPDDAAQEPEPVHFDDVREPLGCEYVAQLCIGSQGPYIAAGNKMYVLVGTVGASPARIFSSLLIFCVVISVWIWFRLFLALRGDLTRIISGVFLVPMARRLCVLSIWMNRFVLTYYLTLMGLRLKIGVLSESIGLHLR